MHFFIFRFPTDLSFTYARDALAAEIIFVYILAGLEFVRLFLGRELSCLLPKLFRQINILDFHMALFCIIDVKDRSDLCLDTVELMNCVKTSMFSRCLFISVSDFCVGLVLCRVSLFLLFFLQVIRAIWQKTKLQSFSLSFSQCHLFSVPCISCYGRPMYCVLMSSSHQSRLSSLAWK